MIPGPFLLYLGHCADAMSIKTSRGLATFRRDECVGEFRHDDCPLTLGLPRLTMVGGEGLYIGLGKTLTSQASLGPLLSREKRERGRCGSVAELNVASFPLRPCYRLSFGARATLKNSDATGE